MNRTPLGNLYSVAANMPFRPALADVYPPFREKLRQFNVIAESDPVAAAALFSEAQTIAKAFWAGVDYACGAEE